MSCEFSTHHSQPSSGRICHPVRMPQKSPRLQAGQDVKNFPLPPPAGLPGKSMAENTISHQGETETISRDQVQEPPLYKVLLHNDDYTTMDFVVMILERVFGKDVEEATRIMWNVHNEGIGVAGLYPREIAETKVVTVHRLAKKSQFPLRCSLEKDA